MTWFEWLLLMIAGSVAFWILSTLLDMGLDWLLARRVQKEIDALNREQGDGR